MLPRALLLLYLLLFSFSAFSQSNQLPDLLEKWNRLQAADKNRADTAIVSLLNAIAFSYFQSAPDKALFYGKKAFNMAVAIGFPEGQSKALANISRSYYVKGAYDLSLNASQQSYEISDKHKDDAGKSNALNGIGLIYLAQDNIQPALEKFQAAAAINKVLKDQDRLAANFINIGICYDELKQPDKAIPALNKGLQICRQINKHNLISLATNRLGLIYHGKKDYQKAIQYYKEVIGNKTYQDDWENSFAYTGLANTYYQLVDYKKAIFHGEKGLKLGKKVAAKWDIERSLEVLHQSYFAVGDYNKAYTYLKQDKIYCDSLFNESKENEINGLHLKQQQSENRELIKRSQLDQQRIRLNYLTILIISMIVVFLAVISLIVYRNNLAKNKLNNKLATLNHTKDQLFSVIGHDLRSPFASILQTLELIRGNDLSKEEIELIMDRFFEKLTATSAMLDNLLLWVNGQKKGIKAKLVAVDLPLVIEQLLSLLNLLALEKKITIQHTVPANAMITADPDHIRIIFQNLIGNAIKFTPENGLIDIFYEVSAVQVIIHIKDNGVGIPLVKQEQLFNVAGQEISSYGTNNEKGIGIGLLLVKKFADENNAVLEIVSEEGLGTEFIVRFRR